MTSAVLYSDDMFLNCNALTGNEGTTLTLVSNVTDKTYAKIDGGETSPGLFSGPVLPTSEVTSILDVDGLPNPSTLDGHCYPGGVAFNSLNLFNFRVHVECADGTDMWIRYNSDSSNFSFSPATLTAGGIVVTVTYRGQMYDIDCFIYRDTDGYEITNISIPPSKTIYVEGERFDATGMVVSVRKFDNSVVNITYNATAAANFTPALNSTLTVNNEKITVKLQEATLDYPITVEPNGNAASITIRTVPTRINYMTGEVFEPAGLVLNVTYPGNI